MLPINTSVQKAYRDRLKTSEAPAFIDTVLPIQPVVNIDYISAGKMIMLSGSQNGLGGGMDGILTIYTVPDNKEFYLTSYSLCVNNTVGVIGIETGAILVYNVTGDSVIAEISTIPSVISRDTISTGLPYPIKLESSATIKLYSSANGVFTYGCVQGYEVDK
jgi:hypothetical protein